MLDFGVSTGTSPRGMPRGEAGRASHMKRGALLKISQALFWPSSRVTVTQQFCYKGVLFESRALVNKCVLPDSRTCGVEDPDSGELSLFCMKRKLSILIAGPFVRCWAIQA